MVIFPFVTAVVLMASLECQTAQPQGAHALGASVMSLTTEYQNPKPTPAPPAPKPTPAPPPSLEKLYRLIPIVQSSALSDFSAPLVLTISTSDAGEDNRAEASMRLLRRELLNAEVESISFDETPAVTGAKSGETTAFTALVVTVLPVVLPQIVKLVNEWLMRGNSQTIALKLSRPGTDLAIQLPAGALSQTDLADVVKQLTSNAK